MRYTSIQLIFLAGAIIQQQLDSLEIRLQQSFALTGTGNGDYESKNQFQAIRLTLGELKEGQAQLQEYFSQSDTVYAFLQKTIAGKEKQQIFFEVNSYQLNEADIQLIQKIATLAKLHKRLKVVVTGYTDLKGSANYNTELASERADVVKKYLIQQGVPPSRVFTQSNGKDYSNNDPAIARRVDIIVVIE